VDKCNSHLKLTWSTGLSVLDRVATKDKSTVPFLTPETKQQSKQLIKKGQPGPFYAKVHASKKKKMVMVFFDSHAESTPITPPRGP
jgi:hypothetical protein